jgi:hypothetical protein
MGGGLSTTPSMSLIRWGLTSTPIHTSEFLTRDAPAHAVASPSSHLTLGERKFYLFSFSVLVLFLSYYIIIFFFFFFFFY